MCEEVSVPCWAPWSAPSPAGLAGFNAAGAAEDNSRWRAMLCSTRIFCLESRVGTRSQDSWSHTAGAGQGLGDTRATVSPPGAALAAAQGACSRSWGGCSLGSSPWRGCTTWVPPPGSPSSSLWAHLGALKELMPKSTQFPNIPTLLIHNPSSCKSGIYS